MPTFNSQALLAELSTTVRAEIARIEQLKARDVSVLLASPPSGGWSAVQHLFHLNFYASFYTEAIEACLDQAKSSPKENFRSGWLGNYFTEIIGPAQGDEPVKVKMKSPANAVPPATDSLDANTELEAFLGFQNRLLYLLQRAQQVNLGGHRVPTSLSNFIRLKLGDIFRFVIAHQERHFQHMERSGVLEPNQKTNA